MDTDNSTEFMTRRGMRSLIFHLLYAMDSFEYQVSLESIVDNFNKAFDLNLSKNSEVFEIANSVILERAELDKKIIPLLANWKFERLGLCTKLILRLAFWEIIHKYFPIVRDNILFLNNLYYVFYTRTCVYLLDLYTQLHQMSLLYL